MLSRKLSYLVIALILIGTVAGYASAQFSIGTPNPDPSAALDIVSTDQGMLHPRLTTAQRDAINGGTFAEGLTIYNTNDKCLQVWDGTSWNCIIGGGGSINNNTDVTVISGGTSTAMVVGEAIPRYNANRSMDVEWLDNDRFIIAEIYRDRTATYDYPPFANEVIATIYNANFNQLDRFTVPMDPDIMGSQTIAVVKLQNDNLMFASVRVDPTFPWANEKFGIVITQQDGTVVSPWQIVADARIGTASGFNPIQDLIVLDNGNVLISGIYVPNNHQPTSIVLQEDGTFIRETRFVASETTMHADSHGAAATSFGFAVFCACYPFSAAPPFPALLELYDFDGNVLATPTFESDSTNPFGPAPYQHYSTAALLRVQGNTLYAGIKRPISSNAGEDEFTNDPIADHMVSGLRKFEVNASGVITVLNDIEVFREIGTPRTRFGNFLTAFPDGKLLAIGSQIPDLWPGGISAEYDPSTGLSDKRNNGASMPIMHFDATGAFTGVTRFVLKGVNDVGSARPLYIPWIDQYAGGFHQHLLLSPDGQKLFNAMNMNPFTYFYTTFDLSSGELVPYPRTLVGNSQPQDLPKTFYIYSVYENLDMVEVTITSGAGTFDTLNCPSCGITGISDNYDVINKVLTLTNLSGTATSDDFTAMLRFLTLAPDGAGTRTLETRAIDTDGNFASKTIAIEVVAP